MSNLVTESEVSNVAKPHHCALRCSSPLTSIALTFHRQGDHRCSGDVIQSLLAMQKLNVKTYFLKIIYIIKIIC